MKKRLVIANWKGYVETERDAKALARAVTRKAVASKVEVRVAPSFLHLAAVSRICTGNGVLVGGQNVSPFREPAHTGFVSATSLKDAGASFVIVGHSEQCAAGMHEGFVHDALHEAAATGLHVVLCVGEHDRDHGDAHFSSIEEQVRSALRGISERVAAKLVIAYEPVWTIGKSAAAAMAPADVQEMVIFIRKVLAETIERSRALRVPILYGGSVEPDNARALIVGGGVAGFLVGHASTDAVSFAAILDACR